MICSRIPSIPLLLVGCWSHNPECRAAEAEPQVAQLIEQLVSSRAPAKEKFRGMPSIDPKVEVARQSLISMGTAIFPELVKQRDDKRYSYSRSYSIIVNHSVGDATEHIMEDVVGAHFRPYSYKSRENPRGTNSQPRFRTLMEEMGGAEKYAEHAKLLGTRAAQREYVQWYMAAEKSHGFIDAKQERDILAPCQKRLFDLEDDSASNRAVRSKG